MNSLPKTVYTGLPTMNRSFGEWSNDVANILNYLVERGTVTAAECIPGQWERRDSEIARMFSERSSWMRVSNLLACRLGRDIY